MRKSRTPIMLALAGVLASLITFVSSGTASAAESLPEMQWTPVQAEAYRYPLTTGPQGDVTIGCGTEVSSYPQDVVTWGASGTEVRHINRTPQVDGKDNCINRPVVDKNGNLYGRLTSGYLYAYNGNTLKWKYQTNCTSYITPPVVGADGNIYTINNNGRLIGLTPEVEPGTTQPKKVLDVATSNGQCADTLLTYKDGLMRVDYNSKVTYYTYGGTQLGAPPTNPSFYPSRMSINAAGRMFYATYTGSGDTAGMKLNAYDPVPGKVAWTAQESTFGPGLTDVVRFYATPDGGAVVHLKRTRMVAGAPTSEKVWALVKVNAHGIKVWDTDLPNADTNGNAVGPQSYISVDTTGKLVLVRWWTKQLTESPWKVPFTTVDVLNVDTGAAVSSPKIMSGNTASSEGEVYGYKVMTSTTPVIGPNTVYVPAQKCTTSCYGDGYTKLYPIKVTGLGLDYPRGAVLTKEKRPATPYLALGDSFSAGEGVEPFEAGTNASDVNECHRSDYAYARVISGTSPKIPALGVQGFRACSGAVTENIRYGPQWNEPGAQLDLPAWPDTTTQLVTLTIGGNDIGFGDFGKACVYWSCAKDSDAYNTSLNAINNTLPGKLVETYKETLQRTPNAKIYVLGYPHVIADKKDGDANDARCSYMYGPHSSGNEWADVEAARDIVTKLNGKIKDQVDAVRALNADYYQRLKYVPLDGANSPFNGREICGSGTSWFQNVDQATNNPNYVFHPNKLGHELGYAVAAAAAINAG